MEFGRHAVERARLLAAVLPGLIVISVGCGAESDAASLAVLEQRAGPRAGVPINLLNRQDGRCLSVGGHRLTNGARMIQSADCQHTSAQWAIGLGSSSVYGNIKALHSDYCLNAGVERSPFEGAAVQQASNCRLTSSEWRFEYLANGYFNIRSRASGLCLSAPTEDEGLGVWAVQSSDCARPQSQWSMSSVSMKTYIMRHGRTEDGKSLTAASKRSLKKTWKNIDCRALARPVVHYLYAQSDGAQNRRFRNTRNIIKSTLKAHCPGLRVASNPLRISRLTSTKARDVQKVFEEIRRADLTRTHIFVLGPMMLHTLTEEEAYLKGWTTFDALFQATRRVHECYHGVDPRNQQFLYDHIYGLGRSSFNQPDCATLVSVARTGPRSACVMERRRLEEAMSCN
ncbi:MAG: RICIN domain-containing protein [Myxococcota bacterium]